LDCFVNKLPFAIFTGSCQNQKLDIRHLNYYGETSDILAGAYKVCKAPEIRDRERRIQNGFIKLPNLKKGTSVERNSFAKIIFANRDDACPR